MVGAAVIPAIPFPAPAPPSGVFDELALVRKEIWAHAIRDNFFGSTPFLTYLKSGHCLVITGVEYAPKTNLLSGDPPRAPKAS